VTNGILAIVPWSSSGLCGSHLDVVVLRVSYSELRIISRRHVDRRQVLSTVDRRPSPVDHTQRPALCTARWQLGLTQRVARSVGVSQHLFYSSMTRCMRCAWWTLDSAECKRALCTS